MSIVAISYGACDTRDNIAATVAEVLGYERIGREVLELASKTFGIPEGKLSRAIRFTPSFFGMSIKIRDRYIAYILAAAAEFMTRDNIVYHGPAAHVIGQGISHVLRVRIISSLESRIAFAMQRDNITREAAETIVANEEKERQKWVKQAFGFDDSEPALYDLVIDATEKSSEEAMDIIVDTLRNKRFQPMTYSMQCASNIELSTRVKAHLIDVDPGVRVRAEDGHVFVDTTIHSKAKDKHSQTIRERIQSLPGVKKIEINITEDLFKRIAGTMR
ncbi:MAG: cytidylate kinase-like family protein [bacterium]